MDVIKHDDIAPTRQKFAARHERVISHTAWSFARSTLRCLGADRQKDDCRATVTVRKCAGLFLRGFWVEEWKGELPRAVGDVRGFGNVR